MVMNKPITNYQIIVQELISLYETGANDASLASRLRSRIEKS